MPGVTDDGGGVVQVRRELRLRGGPQEEGEHCTYRTGLIKSGPQVARIFNQVEAEAARIKLTKLGVPLF